jgi:hypothetical protein
MRAAIEVWLKQHCAVVQNTALGVVLLRRGDGLHTAASWPADRSLPPAVVSAASAAVARRARVSGATTNRNGGERLEVVAHPLEVSGVLIGAAVVVIVAPQAVPAIAQRSLDDSVSRFSPALVAEQQRGSRPADPAAKVLELAQAAFAHRRFRESATALAATLASELKCDRVTLGLRTHGHTRVEAVSDGSKVHADRGAYPDIAAAMDEAIDEGATISYPPAPDAPPRIVAAHAHLARRQGVGALCSVPLIQGQQIIGAISLERADGDPFDGAAIALLEALSRTVGPWLVTQSHAAQPWYRRAQRAMRDAAQVLHAPGSGRYKLAAIAAGFVAGALLLLPAQHEVKAAARLEGTVQRVMAAPGDGYLKQVFVRPGDTVKADQLLVEFAGEDLQVERRRLLAEIAGEDAAAGDAMSKGDRAQLAIHGAKADELKAQLGLIDQRIERSQIKAPFDAVVIAGDLTQALGAPVKKGDVLLTLAPSNGFRAIVEVDDADIGQVRQGQTGSMVLTALPNQALPLRVQRITPLATLSAGRNVFEIEVGLERDAAGAVDELRPGMRGVARLQVGEMPIAMLWTRDVVAWLRLASWRWIG